MLNKDGHPRPPERTIANINLPFEMKLIYFCRHILERQDLFVSREERIRNKVEKVYANSSPVLPMELERIIPIDNLNVEWFNEECGFDAPFVLKGVLGGHTLSWHDLRDTYGRSTVPVHPAAELGSNWQYQHTSQMKLGDAMRAMERGAPISVVSTSQVFVDHKELLAALKPEVLAAIFGVNFIRHEMFVAGPGTGSAFHCTVGGNFFHMVCGQKQWVLVGSQDSFAMYPTIGRNMRSAVFCSPINSEIYEKEQQDLYPLYSKVRKYSVTLEPGDILYVPSLWWHEVKNIGPTIGVPFRIWGGRNRSFFLLLTILSRYGLKYLPKALVAKITGNPKWLMTDGIPQETFGGNRPRLVPTRSGVLLNLPKGRQRV